MSERNEKIIQEIFNFFIKYEGYFRNRLFYLNESEFREFYNQMICDNVEHVASIYDSKKISVRSFMLNRSNAMIYHTHRKFRIANKHEKSFSGLNDGKEEEDTDNSIPDKRTRNPVSIAISNESLDTICWALHKIPSIYKIVATGIYEGITQEEMAKERGCSQQRIGEIKQQIKVYVLKTMKSEKGPTGYSRNFTVDEIACGSLSMKKSCEVCGKEFETTCETKKYCSEKCKNRATWLKQKKRRNDGN